MTSDPHSWGKPLAALLGALKMQTAFGLPSIGGKDSMSGSFENLDVPPTLVAFGITMVDAKNVISPEFKHPGNYIYLVKHTPLKNRMPDVEQLKRNWNFVHDEISSGCVVSSWSVGFGGVAEALAKMSFGNNLGADVTVDAMKEMGIIKNPKDGVKILGNGELTKKLNVKANAFSASAKEKIEALGGKAEVI